jgi:hypothetical protein
MSEAERSVRGVSPSRAFLALNEEYSMDQPRQVRSRLGIGAIGLAITFSGLLLGATICVSGCGDSQTEGTVQGVGESSKTPDAQDSMKAYMKSMQTKGMKPGMKSAAPAK